MAVPSPTLPLSELSRAAAAHAPLRLLVLHGSRARGEAGEASDWDFAYLASGSVDLLSLIEELGRVLGTERVDLADLARSSGVLRHRVARDEAVVFERVPGDHERFVIEAASFWCDVGPLVRAGYEEALSGLAPVLDVEVLGEKAAAVERHLARVATKLPERAVDLLPGTDASDAVLLHLWQGTQIVLDLAISACVALKLGAPSSYGEAFTRLAAAGHLPAEVAGRLVKAAGFRNLVAHAYESVDLLRVHEAARNGPADLRAFLSALSKLTVGRDGKV